MPNTNIAEQGNHLADQAAHVADKAVKSTQRATNNAFDSLAGGVQNLREEVAPAINRASTLAQKGIDGIVDSANQVRERALHATDSTVSYIKDEPVKAMLIAAAVGAGLMALLSLTTRSSGRG